MLTHEKSVSRPNKSIVAIYTHPELGSTVISKGFSVSEPGPVAFVTSTFDIPTPGVTGGGTGGDGATSDMKSCSLMMTGDTFRTVAFGTNLLWFFFAAPMQAAAELASTTAVEHHVFTVVLTAGATWTGVEGGGSGGCSITREKNMNIIAPIVLLLILALLAGVLRLRAKPVAAQKKKEKFI